MNINLILIGQLIAFVAFVAFCMRYVWPPIAGAMAERQDKIADGLAAADRAGHDLEVAKQQAAFEQKYGSKFGAGVGQMRASVRAGSRHAGHGAAGAGSHGVGHSVARGRARTVPEGRRAAGARHGRR